MYFWKLNFADIVYLDEMKVASACMSFVVSFETRSSTAITNIMSIEDILMCTECYLMTYTNAGICWIIFSLLCEINNIL